MRFFMGLAHAKGFSVSLFNLKERTNVSVKSSNYSDYVEEKISAIKFLKRIFCNFFILSILPSIAHYLFLWKENNWKNAISLSALLLFTLTVATAVVFLKPSFKDKKLKQWHSCEHKLINLLKQAIKQKSTDMIILDNLRKMSRTYFNCSTTIHLFFALAVLFGYIIILVTPIEYYDLFMYGVISYLGIKRFVLLFLAFVILLRLISVPFQYLFFTAKPTQEQLEETIRVGEEFLKKYK